MNAKRMAVGIGDTVKVVSLPIDAERFGGHYLEQVGVVLGKKSSVFEVSFFEIGGAGSFKASSLKVIVKGVTLESESAAGDMPVSVTHYCVICGQPLIGKRAGSKTDTSTCRKALSRREKREAVML